MMLRFRKLLGWLGGHPPQVLAAALAVVLGTWGFIALADEVTEGETQPFDEWAVRALQQPDPEAGLLPSGPNADVRRTVPIGPGWLREVGRDATGLGGVAVLALVTLGVALYLLLIRKYHAMWLVIIASAGGLAISSLLKNAFGRPRPQVTHSSIVHTSSFPSGHSMLSAVVYLTLGVLLARLVPQRLLKLYFLALALFLTFIVGVSRVYMGVHYPTDVLAGWTAGLVWALLCYLAARYLQRRGHVERDVDNPDSADGRVNTP
jgi:undecaprenyl-diphosphatase